MRKYHIIIAGLVVIFDRLTKGLISQKMRRRGSSFCPRPAMLSVLAVNVLTLRCARWSRSTKMIWKTSSAGVAPHMLFFLASQIAA